MVGVFVLPPGQIPLVFREPGQQSVCQTMVNFIAHIAAPFLSVFYNSLNLLSTKVIF
jgi:hypothetical protein